MKTHFTGLAIATLLVVAPGGDFAADSNLVEQWFQSLTASKQLVRGEWDNHFFRGHEDRLAKTVFDFLSSTWGTDAVNP